MGEFLREAGDPPMVLATPAESAFAILGYFRHRPRAWADGSNPRPTRARACLSNKIPLPAPVLCNAAPSIPTRAGGSSSVRRLGGFPSRRSVIGTSSLASRVRARSGSSLSDPRNSRRYYSITDGSTATLSHLTASFFRTASSSTMSRCSPTTTRRWTDYCLSTTPPKRP